MENANIIIEYTVNEARVLLEMIDIAVRARGLEAAEAGLVLSRKITSKIKPLEAPPAPESAPAQENSFAPHIIKP